MNKLKSFTFKMFYILIFSFSIISLSYSICYAQDLSSSDIRNTVKSNLQPYLISMDNEKSHFNMTDTESAKDIVIGKGYQIYNISTKHIEDVLNHKDSASTEKMFTKTNFYIFPLYLNNKPIAIAVVDNSNGQYKIEKINSYATFENDLNTATSILEINDDSNRKIIYDEQFGIKAVTSSNINSITFMSYNKLLNINAKEKKSSNEIMNNIITLYKQPKSENNVTRSGGVVLNETKPEHTLNKSTIIPITGIGLIFIITMYILLVRRYKHAK